MSRDLDEDTYYVTRGGRVPIKWTAPEAILYKKYSTSSDVWSYGMLMYEIWSLGHTPFGDSQPNQVSYHLCMYVNVQYVYYVTINACRSDYL